MADTLNEHTILFKRPDGTWEEVPVVYQTAYYAYAKHCADNGIEAISISEFYGVFNMLANADFLNELINAVGGAGVLPLQVGGTGATTAEGVRNNLSVYSKSETDLLLDALWDRLIDLEDAHAELASKLDSLTLSDLGINIGEEAPDAQSTPGEIYFRVS